MRYIPDRNLPDKAIDLLDEGCAMLRIRTKEEPETLLYCREQLEAAELDKETAILRQDFEQAAKLRDQCLALRESESAVRARWEQEQSGRMPVLSREHIAELLANRVGTPIKANGTEHEQMLLSLENRLNERVIGQTEAIGVLCRAIRRNQSGIRDPNRPICSFMFAGSSGVGKTELCRVLAQELFDTSDALIRLDMSEYTERHSVSRLIGSPPGYIGFEEGGQLTERVRRRPYSVVLFDEIEKAHGDVYHLLLQILEDGVLSDSSGRSVDFKNTILILTSNIGEGMVGSAHRSGFSSLTAEESMQQQKQEKREQHLRSVFRPELLNRLDGIIWFSPLQEQHLTKIASLLLQKTAARLCEMGITLTVDDGAILALCREEGERGVGARPLRRTITEKIENLLAGMLLRGELSCGDTAEISYADQGYHCIVIHGSKTAGESD
ncbi:MAG: ATP-dependent Clp protease ATP-binding subunit [Clostridia bacterium]|nr:ATP-dependent Clp protease ATP-binding subunit [Clostridia bacterium]